MSDIRQYTYKGKHRFPSSKRAIALKMAFAGAAVVGYAALTAPTANAAPEEVWDRLAQCESSGNWGINTGNGFSGGLQFTPSTWRAFGGTGSAHQASREQQIAVAERVLAGQGWNAWPACSRKLGITGHAASPHAAPPAAKIVLTASGKAHTVKPGDTLSEIAARYGTSWKALQAKNGLANANVLRIGQKIKV